MVLSILLCLSCQNQDSDESCLDRYIGQSIEEVQLDDNLILEKVNEDSIKYLFYFSENSNFVSFLKENKLGGAQEITVHPTRPFISLLVLVG